MLMVTVGIKCTRCTFTKRSSFLMRGGALLDVLGALSIMGIALLIYASSRPSNMQDTQAQQAAWWHRQVSQAVFAYARANYSTIKNNLTTVDTIVRLENDDWSGYLPPALRDANGGLRANTLGHTSCVLVRQKFVKNVQEISVGTGELEVVHFAIGGTALKVMQSKVALSSGGLGEFVLTADQLEARGVNPAWTIADVDVYRQSVAGKTCNSNTTEWSNRLLARRVLGALSDETTQSNSEYLASKSSNSDAWLRTMETQLRLGNRTGQSNTIGNVDALGELAQVNLNSACSLTQMGQYNRSTTSANTPVSELLQCQLISGLYQWAPVTGTLAAQSLHTQRMYVGVLRDENGACTNDSLGAMTRTKNGAPLICMGSDSAQNNKRWVRVGVPWAWITRSDSLLQLTTQSTLLSNGGYEMNLNAVGIPTAARMIQLYIEVTLPPGSQQAKSITVQMRKKIGATLQPAIELLKVPDHPTLTVYQGRPVLIDRSSDAASYVFTLEGDASSTPDAQLMINLLGYAY